MAMLFFPNTPAESLFTMILRTYFLLFVLTLFTSTTHGQERKLNIEYLGIENGLSNNYVTKIFEDKNGFMWFGTQGGLNKYDGYSFTTYKSLPNDEHSIPDNRITDVANDQDGTIYVASKIGAGILGKDGKSFTRIKLKEKNLSKPIDFTINQLKFYSGKMWMATEKAGLSYIKDAQAYSIPALISGKATTSYNATTLAVDKNKTLWFTIQGQGLYYLDAKANIAKPKQTQIITVNYMLIAADGDMWFAGNNGITRYNQKNNTYKYYNQQNGLPSDNVVCLYIDKTNKIWAGTDGFGVAIIDTETDKITHLTERDTENTLSSNSIFAIYQDKQSRTWIGTLRGGINIIDPNKGKFQLVRNNLHSKKINPNDFILSFAEGNDNSIWIGTDGSGLLKWNKKTNNFQDFKQNTTDLRQGFVTSILTENDHVWVATYGGGVTKLNEKTGKTQYYSCSYPQTDYANRAVWLLYQDKQKRIWTSTLNGGGLLQYNPKTDRFENLNIDIRDAICLFEESASVFWFGTWSEFSRIDLNSKAKTTISVGSPVRFIHQDKDPNYLWIGTEGSGLLLFNKKTEEKKQFTEADGLPSNILLNILEDNTGCYWVSTFNGIFKFDPKSKRIQNYNESDGLQSSQFNYNAALKLRSGELVFGGIRGFNLFNPKSIQLQVKPPNIALTHILFNNKTFSLFQDNDVDIHNVEQIEIPYDEAVLSIAYAALEYSFPGKIKYAYRLEGWDKNWNYVEGQRLAYYSYLKEGKYKFRVKSTDANGIWQNNERVIEIRVLPPWWRTWWAYTFYLILMAGALYQYFIYVKRQARLKYRVRLSQLEVEKEREVNEKKLSFFTHIAHEFRTPLTLIVNPVKEILQQEESPANKSELTNVYNNSKRLLSLVDKLLLFRKAESDFDELRLVQLDVVQLCQETFHCFSQMAESKKIDYQFNADSEHCIILGDRDKLEISIFNLINNALKYTPENGKVEISILTVHENRVDIFIADTGYGIHAEVGKDIFNLYQRDHKSNRMAKEGFGIGLFLVKRFTDAHKGTITFDSELQVGSTFKLSLQKGEIHFKGYTIFQDTQKQSVFLDELLHETEQDNPIQEVIAREKQSEKAEIEYKEISEIVSDKNIILIVDDNEDIRNYIRKTFENAFDILEAPDAETALKILKEKEPHIIISDVMMGDMSGIEFCTIVKQDQRWQHIPLILLTASAATDIKLKGIEGGADDYITKPFDKDILVARVANLIKNRNQLQSYFYNEITLQSNDYAVSDELKEFLKRAIEIVELHLDSTDFTVKTLADQLGMSHSNLYKRIKSISGKSASEFIRYIRLRKVAQLLIETDLNINEAAFTAGFSDIKYFRQQFQKVFGIKPSEYKKKYQSFKKKHKVKLK